jgi:type IV pilus assembly protein PilV
MGKDAQGPRMARKRQHGATLLEALLAATLLALATLAALHLSSQAAVGSRAALQRARAVELAAELAERLQTDPQADIVTWHSEAVALLAPGGMPAANEAASVQYLPATATAPAGWHIQLRWIDAADGKLASHSALIRRAALRS